MRVAVVGASGLVGHAIAHGLARNGFEVRRAGRGELHDISIDLAGHIAADAFLGCDAVVHAAGVTDEDFADREAAWRKAVRGTDALVESALASRVRALAYVSSAHVYGPLEGRIDEARTPDPRSDYARAHRAAEQRFERAASEGDVRILIARPCAVYGMPPSLARFRRWSLIPFDFPRQALQGAIRLKSSGEQRRNFVSADGIASLVGWWLEKDARGATIANAPGRAEMSVYEFARLCARIAPGITGRHCEVVRPDDAAPAGVPLEYGTRVGGPLPGPSLEDHVRGLVAALEGGRS